MPFDPFFSSANMKHYIEVPGVTELADKLMKLPYDERCKAIEEMRSHRLTKVEYCAIKRVQFVHHGRTLARIHRRIEKKVEKATEEFKQGKRVRRILTNALPYNTTSGAVNPIQTHGFGAK